MSVENGHKYNLVILKWNIESGCIQQTCVWGLNIFLYKAVT